MAIYHLHVKVIQRSKGQSAVSSAAYRHATKLFDVRENQHWNYTHKADVIHCEVLVPEGSPAWAQALIAVDANAASENLWNKVEEAEKLKTAQLAREVEFSLPIELEQAEALQLARNFIQDQFVANGMIADWSVHWDKGNPHVHVMLTLRELTPSGFGLKVREWNHKSLLQTWREQWATYANYYLHLNQKEARIDHRSYEEQGIQLVPMIHLGKAVTDMDKRGIERQRLKEANNIGRENLNRIAQNPAALLKKMDNHSDTFTKHHVGQELGRYLSDQGKFSAHASEIFADKIIAQLHDEETQIHPDALLSPAAIAGILKTIEQHESVFTEKQIAKTVQAFTNNSEAFAKAAIALKASPDLIHLGPGEDGRDRFTTRRMFHIENDIQATTDNLRNRKHLKISERRVQSVLKQHQIKSGKQLTEEQLSAVKHVLKPTSIACVVGRAGTGKSFSVGAARAVWEAQNLRILGVALSGIAADGLTKDAGITSRTIESFRHALTEGTLSLSHKDVVVMDEAGMTDSVSMLAVLHAVFEARAKLVLLGDPAQIQPVGPGASFRALLERLGFAEIQTVYRQKEAWQRLATVSLSAGRAAEGLAAYATQNCIHWAVTEAVAMTQLMTDWQQTRSQHPNKDLNQYLVLAHRNQDVQAFNTRLRAARVRQGEIAEGCTVKTKLGLILIAQGDRLLFLKNDRTLGVSNGRFATITAVDFTESGQVQHFTVQLDGSNKTVQINPAEYADFAHGYAATVHKAQGLTVDHTFVYAGGTQWNRNLTYVAMTRHRETCHLYADKTTHQNETTLTRQLSRFGIKDSLLDFPLAFAERRGIDTTELLKRLPQHLAEHLRRLTERLAKQVEQRLNPESFARRCVNRAIAKIAAESPSPAVDIEAITKRREDARLVAAYVDSQKEVGMAWQALQAECKAMGLDGLSYEPTTFALMANNKTTLRMQAAQQSRNTHAHAIIQNPARYQKAIEIYDLDLKQLQKQALQHQRILKMQQYAVWCEKGAVVLRDRLAAELACDIKGYYAALKSAGLDGKVLKQHALAHLRRQCLAPLTIEERATFKVVEAYQKVTQQIGHFFTETADQKIPPPLTHSALAQLETLHLTRERLAQQILSERARYDKALDFYQIGIATPRLGEKPTDAQIRQAESRWYKLQQAAGRHTTRERVQAYHQALFVGDIRSRMQLAAEIVQDTKGHHPAILGLKKQTLEVWRAIYRDAKYYERQMALQKLPPSEQVAFKTVAAYVQAKSAHRLAWREIFESKKTAQLDPKTLDILVANHIARHTQARNQFAAQILANPSLHAAGLAHFEINWQELQPQAHQHHCQEQVRHYFNQPKGLARAHSARDLIADPKSYHGFILAQGLNWKEIYCDAAIAERHQQFKKLTAEEKAIHRLTARYHAAHRKAGKLWGQIKTQNSNDTTPIKTPQPKAEKTKALCQQVFAKRDYLAWRLVNAFSTIDPQRQTAANYRLKVKSLLQQSQKHHARLQVVAHQQWAIQTAVKATRAIHSQETKPTELQSALTAVEIAIQTQKRNQSQSLVALDYALQMQGITKKAWQQQTEGVVALKGHLQALTRYNPVDEKAVRQAITQQVQTAPAAPQRIDVTRLRADLNARAEEIATHYLGQPKIRQGNAWRYGSHQGSLVVNVKGHKQGLWRDFQTNDGGDLLKLIGHATGLTRFKDVLQEATRFLGGESSYLSPTQPTTQTLAVAQKNDAALDAYTLQKIQKAQAIYQATQPIAGTLAEKYLREHRGITADLHPQTFRYHPALKNWMTGDVYPALVLAARDSNDKVCGIQAIFLDPTTAKKAPLGGQTKLSRGLMGEGALVQRGAPTAQIALAEGPETALSIASSRPDLTVYVTFGVSNFEQVALNQVKDSVLICADHDGRDSGTAKSVARAAKHLAQKGIDVWVALPEKPENEKKWDFNDALKTQGIEQVKQDLEKATLQQAGIRPVDIAADMKATLALIDRPVQLIATAALPMAVSAPVATQGHDKTTTTTRITPVNESLEALLTRYVLMEIEQTRLITVMHETHRKNPAQSQDAVTQVMEHGKWVQALVQTIKQRDDIALRLETLQAVPLTTLSENGGYSGIQARIEGNQWQPEDLKTLLHRFHSYQTTAKVPTPTPAPTQKPATEAQKAEVTTSQALPEAPKMTTTAEKVTQSSRGVLARRSLGVDGTAGTSSQTTIAPVESLSSYLQQYVTLEAEQTRLITAMNEASKQDPESHPAKMTAVIEHGQKIQTIANHIRKHSDLRTQFESMGHVPLHSLDKLGGFAGIAERIKDGQWQPEDLKAILQPFGRHLTPTTAQMTTQSLAAAAQTDSLENYLHRYVVMRIEQTRLVSASLGDKDLKARQESDHQLNEHERKFKVLAQEITEKFDISAEMEKAKNLFGPTLPERGGFKGIRDRIEAGEWHKDDKNLLLSNLWSNIQQAKRTQAEKEARDRGGCHR